MIFSNIVGFGSIFFIAPHNIYLYIYVILKQVFFAPQMLGLFLRFKHEDIKENMLSVTGVSDDNQKSRQHCFSQDSLTGGSGL